MKVWELEEGKEYTSNAFCDLETTKYKVIDGELYYSNLTVNYGDYMKSGMEYNRASYLDFIEYTPPTDWSKVEVDTKVLVKDFGSSVWSKRYFAEYKDGEYYAYTGGKTSWNSDGDEIKWNQMKLYTEE